MKCIEGLILIGGILGLMFVGYCITEVNISRDTLCPVDTEITTPIGYDDFGMMMKDGSVWGTYNTEWEINHTYKYNDCWTGNNCVCPIGTFRPFSKKNYEDITDDYNRKVNS